MREWKVYFSLTGKSLASFSVSVHKGSEKSFLNEQMKTKKGIEAKVNGLIRNEHSCIKVENDKISSKSRNLIFCQI